MKTLLRVMRVMGLKERLGRSRGEVVLECVGGGVGVVNGCR